ncbi:hypothetical protein BGPG180_15110 [Staphylococcus epidermidis]|nr:hypothetical protein [Staphylococcus aureus]
MYFVGKFDSPQDRARFEKEVIYQQVYKLIPNEYKTNYKKEKENYMQCA